MKKRKFIKYLNLFLSILLCFLITTFVGCEVQTVEENTKPEMFITIEKSDSYRVVYHKETKVMYAVSMSAYNHGNFTLLVDEEGKPLLWEGE